MAATCGLPSSRFEFVDIVTSFQIDENYNTGTYADTNTPQMGLFISPSTVTGRVAVTNGPLVAATKEGKVQWDSPAGFAFTLVISDLEDVDTTGVVDNSVFTFDGTNWVPSSSMAIANLTTTTGTTAIGRNNGTDAIGFYGNAAVALPAGPNATYNGANWAANGSNMSAGDATYLGYTIEGVIVNLREIGVIA